MATNDDDGLPRIEIITVVRPGLAQRPPDVIEGAMFDLGVVVLTPGAQVLPEHQIVAMLARHARGDFGEVDDEDVMRNREHVTYGSGMVMSAYAIDESGPHNSHGDNTMWVITSPDRSHTTVLLPEEY